MMKIDRILVPIDFSEASAAALRYAIDLATNVKAEIVVVHTWELSAFASPTSKLALAMKHDLELELEGFVGQADARGLAIRRELLLGPSVSEIVGAATRLRADLIVMGSTGRTGLPHVVLGSVAERVVRMAPCPVLTVRSYAHAPAARA